MNAASAPKVILTAVVLTHNEAAHIAHCLATLQFADRRLVFDSFSDDETVSIARSSGAEVRQHRFQNFASQRNAALKILRGKSEWVLFIDADERVPAELAAEISSVIGDEGYAGWQMPRHNYICGILTLYAGWYPDHQTRLLRLDRARYDPARPVHEVVQLDGRLGTLQTPLVHHNYQNWSQFRQKQRVYAEHTAAQLQKAGVRPRWRQLWLPPLREFRRRFFTLQGYRMGWHGLRLSWQMAAFEARSYRLLRGRLRAKATLRYHSPPSITGHDE